MRARPSLLLLGIVALAGCHRAPPSRRAAPKTGEELLNGMHWDPTPIDWKRPVPTAPVDDGYVGSAACTGCHEKIAKKWARHSMARTGVRKIDAALAATLRPAFDSGQIVRHAGSGLSYRPYREGDRFYVEELIDGPDGKRLHSWTAPVTHTFTSGTFGLAFGFRQGSFVYQVPIDWYTGSKQFGMDPGYRHNMRFRLALATSCITCHSDYPKHPPGNEAVWIDPLPQGIGCERCHGPGAKHVESADKKDIVNPARLGQRQQLEVCAQCHLEGAAENLRAGQHHFDYRPGEPLSAWRMNYVEADAQPDWFRVTDHADRLSRSACFLKSAGKMTCTTCHDPHQSSLEVTRLDWRAGCLKCHQQQQCTGPAAERAANGDDCAKCHMRRDTPQDFKMGVNGIPLPISDHWIRKRISPPEPLGSPVRPLTGPMVPWAQRFGEQPAGADLEALYGMAFHLTGRDPEALPHIVEGVTQGGMVRRALEFLSDKYQSLWIGRARTPEARKRAADGARLARAAVLRSEPDDADALVDYARAIWSTGGRPDDPEAMAALDRALKVVPDHPLALQAKGAALFRAGRRDEALPLLRKAADAGPDQLETHVLLGVLERDAGRLDAAAAQLELALQRSPFDRWLLRQLDGIYGKLSQAVRRDRIARLTDAAEHLNPGHAPSASTQFLPRESL